MSAQDCWWGRCSIILPGNTENQQVMGPCHHHVQGTALGRLTHVEEKGREQGASPAWCGHLVVVLGVSVKGTEPVP